MAAFYTVDDLESRGRLDAGHDLPARLAVIGKPVGHSASPVMHQAALAAAGLAMRYVRIEVEPGQVAEAVERMRVLGFVGCNVTVPHKLEVMAACGVLSDGARALGAVNTVWFDGAVTRGFNTDGPGFVRAVESAFGSGLRGRRVAIVGACGGAGRALAAQCVLEGVAQLVLVNRTVGKLDALTAHLTALGPAVELLAMALDDPRLIESIRSCELVVNASSVGLKEGDPAVLPEACLRAGQWAYDCIYQPPQTPWLRLAAAAGCQCANGRGMLLHQGALAFQTWFPGSDPLTVMDAALP